MRLFLYGTLLDPNLLARIAGRALSLTPATLHGWRRLSLRDRRYPTLLRAPGKVEGAITEVNGHALARLAAYEGPLYRLRPVVVRTARGNQAAWCWIAPNGTLRDWPEKPTGVPQGCAR